MVTYDVLENKEYNRIMSMFDHIFRACGHTCVVKAPVETHKDNLVLPLLTPVDKYDEM